MNLRKEARGRECQVRIPYVCSHDCDTVVLAHLPGAGMGKKMPNWAGAWACGACHDVLDGRVKTGYGKDMLRLMHLDGMVRTLLILDSEGKF